MWSSTFSSPPKKAFGNNYTFQIAEVNKALGFVSYIINQGYTVTFDKEQESGNDLSLMVHKASGRVTQCRRECNIWVLDAMIKSEGFGRQA